MDELQHQDPEIARAIALEEQRQLSKLELIASENFTSRGRPAGHGQRADQQVRRGLPRQALLRRLRVVDRPSLAIDRAKELFGAEHANVQPHSGAQANMAVYFALLEPGDTILGMDLAHGGHLTHGSPVNFSGKLYNVVPTYGVARDRDRIDYDEVRRLAGAPAQADRRRRQRLPAHHRLRRASARSPTRSGAC
jgi:glycine hydroxymethyltransferase